MCERDLKKNKKRGLDTLISFTLHLAAFAGWLKQLGVLENDYE